MTHLELSAALSLDAYHHLFGEIRHGESYLGRLSLFRHGSDADYADRELQDLVDHLEYIAAGLACDDPGQGKAGTQLRGALMAREYLICSRQGDIVSASSDGTRLARMALAVAPDKADDETAEVKISEFVDAVACQVGQQRMEIENLWGTFEIGGYPIQSGPKSQADLGIVVTRFQPKVVDLLTKLWSLDLPPQQQQVGLLFAQGNRVDQISESLSISVNTVAYHLREISKRVLARNRKELAAHLLSPPSNK